MENGTCNANEARKQMKSWDMEKKYQELPYFSMWQVVWCWHIAPLCDVHGL